MSTINQKYTFQYSQPTEYHFSHDSVFLAQFVCDWFIKNTNTKINQMADVCAGCGIIGMDLLFHLNQHQIPMPKGIDFIEIQNIYESHFEKNKIELLNHINLMNLNWVCENYANLNSNDNFKSKYDLIVCNPPYFKPNQGKLSPSEFKNRCRFFIDSDFVNLIKFIKHALTSNGCAFILLRSLADHNDDWGLDQLSEQFELTFEYVGDVRGTVVVLVRN